MNLTELKRAHNKSSYHVEELRNSNLYGCFYCEATYPVSDIREWIDREQTALCAHCGIDSVIGDASGIALTPQFLAEMRAYWFDTVYTNIEQIL